MCVCNRVDRAARQCILTPIFRHKITLTAILDYVKCVFWMASKYGSWLGSTHVSSVRGMLRGGAVCTRAVGAGGAIAPSPQILADQLSLCQLGVQIMPTTLILAPPPPDFRTFLRPCILCKLTTNLFQGSHETQHEAINKPLKSRFVIFFSLL